jgi:peptidoglycan/LPS O-acetylase OafA/YrhL
MFLGSYTIPRWDLARALTLMPFGQIKYVLHVEWSLTYEIFFYLVCAIWALKPIRKYYLPFLIVWFFIILRFPLFQSSMLLKFSQIFLSQYNYYFILGGFIYYLNKSKQVKDQRIALIISLAFVGIYTTLFYFRMYPPLNPTLLLSIAFAGFLYGVIQLKTSSKNTLVALGDYSYGLYLTHMPIIIIIFTLWSQFVDKINSFAGFLAFGTALTFGWHFGKFDVGLHRWIKTQSGLSRLL